MKSRRDHPRIGVTLHARLTLPDGSVVEGETQNLSYAGFQLAVDSRAVSCLFPQTRQPGPRERQRAEVSLSLDGVSAAEVAIDCAAVFARRMAQSQWHVGFEFVDPDPSAQLWIEARIASALRPGTATSTDSRGRGA